MARLALSVGGAVVGFMVGGPAGAQAGWMAGSLLGSLMPQTVRGPSIDEAGTQTTQEGAPRAVVYGTAAVSGNVIDAGRTRRITKKQRQGKGGQSVETEALLRTYAIRICEGPIAGILLVKRDEKIVYDARPGANFDEDNAKFLKGCRLYLGDEEQLPDPDMEALRGVGEVPAYRGSAYIVFVDDDVTDRRGSVPQYEFVVGKDAGFGDMALYIALDSSGSMGEMTGNGKTRWENARSAVVTFLEALREATGRVDIQLVLWGGQTANEFARSSIVRRSATSSDIDALIAFMPSTTIGYGTAFRAAVADAPAFFDDSPPELRRVSMFITDGEPSYWDGSTWVTGEAANANATLAGATLLDIENLSAYAFNIDLENTEQTAKLDNTAWDGVPVLDGSDPDALASILLRVAVAQPAALADIVTDLHARCGIESSSIDVSELVDQVYGLTLASVGYTGADAVNTLRAPYFFDRSEWGGVLRYPKRGKPVVATLAFADLVEEPDDTTRQAAIEYPRKLHLSYTSPEVNFEAAQASSSRSSPDVRVTGERSVQVPVVLTAEAATRMAAMMHKISYAEAEGQVEFSVPDSFLRLVPSDCIALSLRGTSRRLRIDNIEHAEGVLKLTANVDRQSAYASSAGYIPLPKPTPPVSGVVGDAVLAVLDVPMLQDADDALYYYAAATGVRPAWRGAQLQRSLDGGASYVDSLELGFPATIGRLQADMAAAAPWYTDRTNVIDVELLRDGDVLDSVTEAQFLQRGGAVALQLADGSWEVAQYRDAEHVSGRRYRLTTLHRGQLNTVSGPHAAGALLVLLEDVSRVSAQSAWIKRVLTHRAPSLGGSVETAASQAMTYAGRAQREWPVASLRLLASGGPVGGSIAASWAPRHRLGTDVLPVASQHFRGFRVYATDAGGQSLTVDVTTQTHTLQLGSMTWPVRVHVAAVNAITGAGPWRWVSTDGTSGEGGGPPDEEPGGETPVGDGSFQRGIAMYGSARAGAYGQLMGGDLFAAQNSGASWQLFKLRADTLEVVRAAYAGPFLFALINDGTSLYGGSDGLVRKWDSDLNQVAQTQVGGTGDAQGLALCGGSLWVSVPYEPAVKKLDPATLAVQATVPGLRINSLVTDGAYLYGASRADNCIYKLNGSTGAIVATFPTAGYPADLVVHGGKLWVICLHDLPVRLYKHDAGTGAKEAFELEVTSTPGRLAMAGDVLGVGGRVSFAINTLDDTVIGSFSIPLDNPSQVQPPTASLITPTRFVAGGFDWTAYYDLI